MKIHPMPILAFLRFYVGFALAGATMLWTVACSSMLLNTAPRSFAPMRTFKHILPTQAQNAVKPASFEDSATRNGPTHGIRPVVLKPRALPSLRGGAAWKDTLMTLTEKPMGSETDPSGLRSHRPEARGVRSYELELGRDGIKPIRHHELAPWRGDYLAAQHLCGLDVRLIAAVVKAESGGDPWALSSSGARGLMQVLESTAAELGDFNLWVPAENLIAGSCILRQHIDYRRGDVLAALEDYHAGRYRARTSAQTLAYAANILSLSGAN